MSEQLGGKALGQIGEEIRRIIEPAIAGTSTLDADLTSRALLVAIIGAASPGSSALDDALGGRALGEADDLSFVISTFDAELGSKALLNPSIAGTSTFSAEVRSSADLEPAIAGSSTFDAEVTSRAELDATIAGTSTFNPTTSDIPPLVATIEGTSTLDAELQSRALLDTDIAGTSTFAAALTASGAVIPDRVVLGGGVYREFEHPPYRKIILTALMPGTSTFSAELNTRKQINASIEGVSFLSAELSVRASLGGLSITRPVNRTKFIVTSKPFTFETLDYQLIAENYVDGEKKLNTVELDNNLLIAA